MRPKYYFVVLFIILSAPAFSAHGQENMDLDFAINMPDIETMEGSVSVPANLDLLTQGIIKIIVDTDDDGNVSAEEAAALWDVLSEKERANMSLMLEDLEPLIQNSIGIDYQEPREVEVLDMEFYGLVGPVNSSTPLAFILRFHAEFDVSDSYTHTVSIAVNESYRGDVDFELTIPPGWEVDRVTGLAGHTVEGRNVYGTPISQIDVRISEEMGTNVLYICIGIGVLVMVVIIIIVLIVVRKKKETAVMPTQPIQQYPPSTPSQQSYPVLPPPQQQSYMSSSPPQTQRPPAPATLQTQQHQVPPPPQTQTYTIPPPPPKPGPNICPQCRSPMSYIQQYQRYYCYSCRQYR